MLTLSHGDQSINLASKFGTNPPDTEYIAVTPDLFFTDVSALQ